MGYARGLTPWLWNLRKLLRLKLYLPPRVRGPAPPRLPVDVPPVAAPVRPVDALAEALQRVRDKLDLVGWLYLYKLGLSLLTKRSCFRHVHDMKLFKPKASKAEIPYVYPILLTGLISSEWKQPDQQETQVQKHDIGLRKESGYDCWLDWHRIFWWIQSPLWGLLFQKLCTISVIVSIESGIFCNFSGEHSNDEEETCENENNILFLLNKISHNK